MPKIFISYRREDSAAVAGRLFDRLEAHFGRGSVFIDVDSIPLGVDFRNHLAAAVKRCDALLAIIGDAWGATGRVDAGLNDPNDFIRIEIEAALARNIPVIPVLVGKTSMPSAQDLPPSLRPLAYRNACTVESGPDFRAQVDRLIRSLERSGTQPAAQPLPGGTIGNPAGTEGESRSAATSRGSAMLLVVSGPKKGTTFELTKDRVLIGRSQACDVFLNAPSLSNYHAQLVRTDGGHSLEDLGSANGSFVNGERVRDRVPLNDGDRIHTGAVILQYRRCD